MSKDISQWIFKAVSDDEIPGERSDLVILWFKTILQVCETSYNNSKSFAYRGLEFFDGSRFNTPELLLEEIDRCRKTIRFNHALSLRALADQSQTWTGEKAKRVHTEALAIISKMQGIGKATDELHRLVSRLVDESNKAS